MDKDGLDIIKEQIQKKTPFRKILINKIRNYYYIVKCFFFPKQRWIKKYIKYHYYDDIPCLIPDFLFGCVIEFVEIEENFKICEYDYYNCSDDKLEYYISNDKSLSYLQTEEEIQEYKKMIIEARTFKREILKCYEYAVLRNEIKNSIGNPKLNKTTYTKWENFIEQNDPQYCKVIIKHYESLWT